MAERETEDTVLICFFLMLSLVKLLVLRQRAEEELHRSNCTSYFPNIVLIHVTMNMDTDLIAVLEVAGCHRIGESYNIWVGRDPQQSSSPTPGNSSSFVPLQHVNLKL